MVPVSPPNQHGFCCFGPGVWMSPTMAHRSRLVIAELCGKTVQERARALCEIAHSDFRDDLLDDARKLYNA